MPSVKEIVNPKEVPMPSGPYSQAVKTKGDKLLFISGQVAENEKGELVGKGDPETQARKVFENLRFCLSEGGADFPDVVKLTIILTNRESYPAVSKVRRELFKNNFPAATSFIVGGLAKPDWLIEVEAIAVV